MGVEASRAPDAEAFAERHADWLARCAYLMTGDREAALDLAQDTLLAVWRSWPKVAAAEDPQAYVARMMMNALRSAKRRKRLSTVSLQVSAGDGRTRTIDPADPSRDHDAVEDRDALGRAIAALPDRQRAVLVLRYWSDLDDAAIAHALACRRSTVRSLAARAFAALRGQLGEDRTSYLRGRDER
jgi:RNA polymerase sigma factor (sigma-70 family)